MSRLKRLRTPSARSGGHRVQPGRHDHHRQRQFLNTLGYSLDEIKAKHHRMFCEAAYTNSQEYANFWAKLNRGELDSGVSRRLGKGGKEVWIQASYNPIMDSKGKVYKVAKFATDVTMHRRRPKSNSKGV